MAYINYPGKKIAVKIVYYGPGLSGKTTNLRYIFSKIEPQSRGDFVCLETDAERTYFFDLLPIKAGLIRDFEVQFSLMTVPGQVFYEASRRSVLKGVDGIVFVADSQVPLLDSNLESFDGMRKNLFSYELDLPSLPLVFQYNKRDLDNLIPVETFNNLLNPDKRPFIEASAINGTGVFETLKAIAKVAIPSVKKKVFGDTADVPKDKGKKVDVRFETEEKSAHVEVTKIKIEDQEEIEGKVDELAGEAAIKKERPE
jgi:signal recognition particle receptor subunit beta